jgi:hypothetical protein
MLSWWLTLRQAEEALHGGRLEEAGRLLQRGTLRGHKRAGVLLASLGRAYLDRAGQHLRRQDWRAACDDLNEAEKLGWHTEAALRLREAVQDLACQEIEQALQAGQPQRVLELVETLRNKQMMTAKTSLLEEAARDWHLADQLAARGDFGAALAALERIPAGEVPPVVAFRQRLQRHQQEVADLVVRLHRALEKQQWREAIALADRILAQAPEHALARSARSKAWKAVEPPTTIAPQFHPQPAGSAEPWDELDRRLLLWIDGVGAYLICLADRVSLGQAATLADVDIPLLADVSRLHAYLSRDAEGYLLEALRPARVNQHGIQKAVLSDGDRITLGHTCQLTFRKPLPLSGTARLELASGHRLPLALDGVILMAEACLLGPEGKAHVVIPELTRPVVLHRRPGGLGVQAPGEIVVNGQTCRERSDLPLPATVCGGEFRFAIEPVQAVLRPTRP